jgi:hypothetical protein
LRSRGNRSEHDRPFQFRAEKKSIHRSGLVLFDTKAFDVIPGQLILWKNPRKRNNMGGMPRRKKRNERTQCATFRGLFVINIQGQGERNFLFLERRFFMGNKKKEKIEQGERKSNAPGNNHTGHGWRGG